MFRRETFHNVGGFAPDMRGSEDCYVTQRILKAGGCWLHVPQLETGHRAIQSVGEMWSKFRGYGYHNVQYVIREQDWLVASWLAGTETEGVMEPAWTSAKTQWNKPGNASVAFPQRLLRAALALLAMLAYRRGWRRGTRVFAAHYGRSVPAVPRLSGRFEAFCREIAVPRDT